MQLVDWAKDLNDFADTAALVENLDLVISVDTSIAHLAGAMARPVWVLIPNQRDFRWLLDRPDSPWYSTMRLFRQRARGDWDSVIARIVDELSDWVKNRR
jgi:ADP-heptose:LPS heptosyltransferase